MATRLLALRAAATANLARAVLMCVGLVVAACDSGPLGPAAAPRETFEWAGLPISIEPPPYGWRREGETSGGVKGARFVKERSVGEAIGVGDYHRVASRMRRATLQEIVDTFDTYDRPGFQNALRRAYAQTDSPFTPLEAEVAEEINAALGRASVAFATGDRDVAQDELGAALVAAERLRFTLVDVIEAVEFTPERRQEPHRWLVLDRRDATIGGEPAVVVDYTFDGPDRQLYGREAYVVRDDHLFVVTFLGLRETLPVFDRVVQSIQFPR